MNITLNPKGKLLWHFVGCSYSQEAVEVLLLFASELLLPPVLTARQRAGRPENPKFIFCTCFKTVVYGNNAGDCTGAIQVLYRVFIYGYIHFFILLTHICVLIYLMLKALHRAEMMYGFHIIGYQARVFFYFK